MKCMCAYRHAFIYYIYTQLHILKRIGQQMISNLVSSFFIISFCVGKSPIGVNYP